MSRLCLRASCRRVSSCLCAAARAVWPGPCLDLQTNSVVHDYGVAAMLAKCILGSPPCTFTKLQHLHVIRPVSQVTSVKACQEHRVMQSCKCIYYASRAVFFFVLAMLIC